MTYELCLIVGFLKCMQRQVECHCCSCLTPYCIIAAALANVDIKAQYLVLSLLLFRSIVALSIHVVLPYIYFNKYFLNVI